MPKAPHAAYGLDGVEIFANASGSHHELRKLGKRYAKVKEASLRNGGVYLYSNLKGCDGGRLYMDGASITCVNGEVISQMPQFSVPEVEVDLVAVDLESVRRYRIHMMSRNR